MLATLNPDQQSLNLTLFNSIVVYFHILIIDFQVIEIIYPTVSIASRNTTSAAASLGCVGGCAAGIEPKTVRRTH